MNMRQLLKIFSKKEPEKKKEIKKLNFFDVDLSDGADDREQILEEINAKVFQKTPTDFLSGDKSKAMDAGISSLKGQFQISNTFLDAAQLSWFASQSFIGYQVCAMLAQQWLIAKACDVPSKDSISKGYELTINNGVEIDTEIKANLREYDDAYRLTKNLLEFVRAGRIYGIRIAIFLVESNDPLYYEKPFNLDGVLPDSYRGILQVEPFWITPELDSDAAANPASIYFYEPTWWRISGQRYHRSHLVIMRNEEVSDILKPSYLFGGLSIPQKIMERVYSAERTANEAPLLSLTKRSTYLHTDLTQVMAQPGKFKRRMESWMRFLNNYGVKILGKDETAEQHETSLADLDAVIMTQYQLVAAASNVPVTKLLGTTPKGFNASGEYDEDSYHEELSNIQTHNLSPLLQRHYDLIIKAIISPKYNIAPFTVCIKWNALKNTSAKEMAELNKMKAETDQLLINNGEISPEEARGRLINDRDSGYNGLIAEIPETEILSEEPEIFE